jgi:hypothetical protein
MAVSPLLREVSKDVAAAFAVVCPVPPLFIGKTPLLMSDAAWVWLASAFPPNAVSFAFTALTIAFRLLAFKAGVFPFLKVRFSILFRSFLQGVLPDKILSVLADVVFAFLL